MPRTRVWVIDDKPSLLQMLRTALQDACEVETFASARLAVQRLAEAVVDVVVTDIRMPEIDGMDVLREVKRMSPDAEVVLMTAYGTVKQAVEAMKLGAYDYVTKPFEPEELLAAVERAAERKRLRERAGFLEREVQTRFGGDSLIGTSPPMQVVYTLVRKVVDTDATVLVIGESGTGKELVARALHYGGKRREGKFVVVHCAGIPRELADSEIFGHTRGAFSGAVAAKRGLAEEADGGTLFLDDVDQLELDTQAKLNRLIQERELRAVGETSWRRVDARIVAATNKDLRARVAAGAFREDLFYRLNVFRIELPALRARPGDVATLVEHCLRKHAARLGVPVPEVTVEARETLARHTWPGNVRELENTLERALILAGGRPIRPDDLGIVPSANLLCAGGPAPSLDLPYADVVERAVAEAARAYLEGILHRFGGNVTRAAEHAGMERQSLHRLLKKHGLRSEDAGAKDTPGPREA